MDNKTFLEQFSKLSKSYTDYEVLDGNNCIITSDWELPDTDPSILLLIKQLAKEYGIDKLIIAGDLVATDQPALNDWAQVFKDEYQPSFGTVMHMATDTIAWLMEEFKSVNVIRGNHDDRVAKKTRGEVHLGTWLEYIGVPYSQYAYLFLNTDRGPVYVCHPKNYSSNSVGLGQKIYNVTEFNGEKCHVVLGHTHQAQMGRSPDKLRDIVALGCLRDPRRTQYLQTSSTVYPSWDQGFLMIRDGFFYPIVIGQTDLRRFLRNRPS